MKPKKKAPKAVCFYFQVHQPLRLSSFNYFDINSSKNIFSDDNKEILEKVAQKSYFPTNEIIYKLLNKYPEFKCSYSLSGTFLDQAENLLPKLIHSFNKLVGTKRVELLSETYYHSLSFLYAKEEFIDQILLHRKKIWELFKYKPNVFRNTELIYNNKIAEFARQLGFNGILAEGWDKYLHWRSPNFLYTAPHEDLPYTYKELLLKKRFNSKIKKNIGLLLKNYKLSDDIAFRFGNRSWAGYPLTADKFADWLSLVPGNTINLFMDYETFGEHQWEDTGIFNFLKKLPEKLLDRGITFRTPSETISELEIKDTISMPQLVSWADLERDLTAWTGNRMQQEALKKVYELKRYIKKVLSKTNDNELKNKILSKWRYLQTSDHFYYMSTKYWSDGDVHAYFSHYESPYDAYINYMNVINNFKNELMSLKF